MKIVNELAWLHTAYEHANLMRCSCCAVASHKMYELTLDTANKKMLNKTDY